MGHREALVKSYMRPKDTDVISEFITHAADILTIDPTQRLRQENQDLRTTQAEEIAQLKERLKLQEEFANGYQEIAQAFRDYSIRNNK